MLKQTTACCYVVIKQTTACYAWVTCLLAPNPSQSKATTRSNCFTSSSKLSNQKPSPLPRPCASTSVRLLETVVVAMSPSLAVSTQLMQFPPGNSTWRQCSVACLTKREIIAACAERRDALLVGIHNRRSTIVQDLLHSTLVVYLHDVRLYSVTARLYNVAICINNRSGTSLKSNMAVRQARQNAGPAEWSKSPFVTCIGGFAHAGLTPWVSGRNFLPLAPCCLLSTAGGGHVKKKKLDDDGR